MPELVAGHAALGRAPLAVAGQAGVMLVETSFCSTSRVSTGPWHSAHESPAATCGAWPKKT